MKTLAVLALLSCIACGNNFLLREGTYDVSGTVVLTTDPLSNNFESQWLVQHRNEGRYKLVLNKATQLFGADSNGRAMFVLDELVGGSDECPFYASLNVELSPTENGFTGTALSAYTWCSSYNANTEEISLADNNTEFFVVGKLKD